MRISIKKAVRSAVALVVIATFVCLSTPQAFAISTGTGGELFPIGTDSGDDFNVGSGLFVLQGNTGKLGIGDSTPASLLTVGSGDLYQVDSSGDMVKIKNVAYSWPSSQGSSNTFLKNDGSGGLSWASASSIMTSLSSLSDATATDTLANANFAQTWNWDSLTTQTAMAVGSTSVTTGKVLSVNSSSTALTSGFLLDVTASGAATSATGYAAKIANTAATSTAGGLFINQVGTGSALRVDDASGDTTPFLIDASGNVGVGTSSPSSSLHVNGSVRIERADATIATGAVTYSNSYMRLDTESAAASDDLDTVSGGNVGDMLIIQSTANARNVVLKDGTGNLALQGNIDFTLDDTSDKIILVKNSTNWEEVSRADN